MTQEKRFMPMAAGGSKRRRWYPHDAIQRVVQSTGAYGSESFTGLDWELMDPKDAAEALPELQANLRDMHRFVARIAAIAEGRWPAECTVCGSRFYSSRSDARYCSGRCRMRAHRAS